MKLPKPRGPVSATLAAALRQSASAGETAAIHEALQQHQHTGSIFYDEDLQVALFMLYELHYRGFDEVDEAWEWDPGLLSVRNHIEMVFESALRQGVGEVPTAEPEAQAVAEALFALAGEDGGPSVSTYVARHATVEQARELLVHKSPYQLKEADPHTWAIPRLTGRAKSALVEIQADEYGGGQAGRMHSELFASTMEGLGLDSAFGAYIDVVPAVSLASVNAMSLFGLHRRFRGAIVGHLAMYEMTSSIPQARYARGFRRLGFDSPVTDYFDEHVEADAVHEQIAGRDLAGALVEEEPVLAADVFFGAAAVGFLDGLVAHWQLEAWEKQESSLLPPIEVAS